METKKPELTAFSLHLLAMFFMLLDHLWATVVPGNFWLTCLGRLAYPIFAFLLVEGYFYTKNLRKYMIRLLFFAFLSEIPFNLMTGGAVFYPVHQNVLWSFLLSLSAIQALEAVKHSGMNRVLKVLARTGIAILAAILGLVTMVDYNAPGVMTVLVFYFFRGRKWYHFCLQLAFLYWINNVLIMGQDLPFHLFGREFFYPSQGLALAALLPIWLYHGKQGPHGKWVRFGFYAFYPVHMLILTALTAG